MLESVAGTTPETASCCAAGGAGGAESGQHLSELLTCSWQEMDPSGNRVLDVRVRLHRNIQVDGVPHSSYEDALAALDLYRSCRTKWEKAMEYKIQKTREIQSRSEVPQ